MRINFSKIRLRDALLRSCSPILGFLHKNREKQRRYWA